MSKAAVAVAVTTGACALAAGAVVVVRRRRLDAELAARAAAAGVSVGVAPVAGGTAESGASFKVPSLSNIAGAVQGGLSGANVVALGINMLNAMGDVAQVVGGEGAADVARAGIGGFGVGAGVIVGKSTQLVAGQLGVSEGWAQTLGQVAGAGAAFGPVGVLIGAQVKAVGEGSKWVVGKVFGEDAAQAISNVTRQLDPTLKGSLLNKPVSLVASGVKKVGKLFGSIF
ncbi:hypothetical protein [Corallococcus silvisoli]|uniref:hypothetical protein n=1 Tax=Corallococcus silvisoli TaxID=2697031 RepID=UPI0013771CDE|nr:hypothetical protein [Corallococcus silvisoli]NBD09636.1 hypothetical protein [Corallococcus silvisoli]